MFMKIEITNNHASELYDRIVAFCPYTGCYATCVVH